MSKRSKFCIIGIPDHQGVHNVNGRIGTAEGPAQFRFYFKRMHGPNQLQEQVIDFGDVQNLGHDVATNHEHAATLIAKTQAPGSRSVIIGGGHDHGYSHLVGISRALSQHKKRITLGCINIDAHLDVRKPNPLIMSGSPFFLALESKILKPKNFIEFGIQSQCNATELWHYASQKKIHIVPYSLLRNKAVDQFRKSLRSLCKISDAVVVSLDLDAAASAFAPGVSAPQSEGFSSAELIQMAEIASQEPKVLSLGIFELNPKFDIDGRTAKLAATIAYHFFEPS